MPIRDAISQRIPQEIKVRIKEHIAGAKARLSRNLRIARGGREYKARWDLARAVASSQRLDITHLREHGFQVLNFNGGALQAVLETSKAKLANGAARPARKGFFSQLLDDSDFAPESPYMRFALDERVLNSVAAYLGKAPFLESIELLYSRPSTQALESSQLWHEDMTEESLVKLFVYVTDVDDRCGPFTLIPRGPSRSVPRHLPHYVDDDTMRRYVGDNQHTVIEGPSGTAFFVDTRNCFHRGSRCVDPRLALVCYYTSGFGYYERLRSWPRPPDALSTIQRLALGHS